MQSRVTDVCWRRDQPFIVHFLQHATFTAAFFLQITITKTTEIQIYNLYKEVTKYVYISS